MDAMANRQESIIQNDVVTILLNQAEIGLDLERYTADQLYNLFIKYAAHWGLDLSPKAQERVLVHLKNNKITHDFFMEALSEARKGLRES